MEASANAARFSVGLAMVRGLSLNEGETFSSVVVRVDQDDLLMITVAREPRSDTHRRGLILAPDQTWTTVVRAEPGRCVAIVTE